MISGNQNNPIHHLIFSKIIKKLDPSETTSWSTNTKGNNKITELRTILQRESQNS